jgi:hypothetical protein
MTSASVLLRLAVLAVIICLYPQALWGVAIAVVWKLWRRHPLAALLISGFLSGLLGGRSRRRW